MIPAHFAERVYAVPVDQMDHLPPVQNPWNPIQVPHYGGVYEGVSFVDYPSEQGWDLEQLQRGTIAEDKREDAAMFVQEWLYFGLMADVLRVNIAYAEFMEIQKDGDEVTFLRLTSKHLPTHMDEWKTWLDTIKQPQYAQQFLNYQIEVAACLRASHAAWLGFKDFHRVAGTVDGIEAGQAVELAICILGTTLENALVLQQVIHRGMCSWIKAKSQFLVARMLDAGWCPSTIEHIRTPLNNTSLYYASLLGPPTQPRGYENAPLRHTECRLDALECQRRIVKDEAYETSHCTSDCQCAFVGPTKEQLKTIIETKDPYCLSQTLMGSIPLVYWDEATEKLQTVAYSRDKQYTAISHVWSDGMGNVNANSLPACRVKWITAFMKDLPWTDVSATEDLTISESVWKRVDQIEEPIYDHDELNKQPLYFWIDTLCVPCNDTDDDSAELSLRKLAMIGMKAVYARANRVIILDSDLLQTLGNTSEEEAYMRIFASTWNRRLWTLQEYVLAKTVWYNLGNHMVSFNEDDETDDMDAYWKNEILRCAKNRDLRSYMRHKPVITGVPILGDCTKIVTVWESLNSRCAKNITDVPICISTLLDMDLAELLSVPAEDRLAKHWSMYKYIPAGILMLPGVKQSRREIRWAPLHMTECVHMPNPRLRPLIRIPNGNLILMLHGIRIGRINGGATGRRTVIPLNLNGEVWYLRQNLHRGNKNWSNIDFRQDDSYALLIGEECIVEQTMQLSSYLVALVRIKETQPDGMLAVEWVNASSLIKHGSPFDTGPGQWMTSQQEEKKSTPVTATYTPDDQWWQVS